MSTMLDADPVAKEETVAPKRLSKAQGAALTRQRVIDAARRLLHTQGYSGASTLAIRDAAGVSLGAMQHHFPTKARLMSAVIRQSSDTWLRNYKVAIRQAKDPADAIRKITAKSADQMQQPGMAAMLEIQLACRNDPDLKRETAPIFERHDRIAGTWLRLLARTAGVTNAVHIERLQWLGNAVIRGLTIDRLNTKKSREVDIILQRWIDLLLEEFFDPAQRFG